MRDMLRDVRYAARSLAGMRGAGAAAVLTLAVGIAATTTMFSVVYAALMRPLPFHDPEQLAVLFLTQRTPRDGLMRQRWSWPSVVELQRSLRSFERVASHTPVTVAISGGQNEPEQIDGEVVSAEYWQVLGVALIQGRAFDAREAAAGVPQVLISTRLWRGRFGADPGLIGRPIRINDVPLTVLGILPEPFAGLSGKADLWIPPSMAARLTYADYLVTPQTFISVVARLAPGVAIDTADAELRALAVRLAPAPGQFTPPGSSWSATAVPLDEVRTDPIVRRSALVLLGAAACVLLIACVNVACLLLARAWTRQREVAIRLAMGASRARIVRQLLAEGLVIAVPAGAGGVLLAAWGLRVVGRTMPAVIPAGQNNYLALAALGPPALDPGVLLFSLAITAATILLCALAPALQSSRRDVSMALKAQERGRTPRGAALPALVVSEMALAMLLLVGSGWLIDNFVRIQHRRVGFDPQHVMTFWVRPPVSRYAAANGPAVVERLLTRVQAVPGVERAAVNRCTPFTGCSGGVMMIPDRPADAGNRYSVGRHYVSADYFATLGIPLLAGRGLLDTDRLGAPLVAVINERGARRFWPGENPIGKRVRFLTQSGAFADPRQSVEIVGVAGDVKYGGVDQADDRGRAELYTSYHQFSWTDTMVILKSRAASQTLVPALRRAIASVDAALPIYDVLTLDDRIDAAVTRPRFNAVLLGGFTGIALLLAALGVYGVLWYSVSTRLRDIGVRLALGANPRRVALGVLAVALRQAALGAAIGMAAAVLLVRLLRQLDAFGQGVSPLDARLYVAGAAVLLVSAAAAAWLPARRAGQVNPVGVLRQE